MSRPFESLSEEEVLALAVYIERANVRKFRAFAGVFRGYDSEVAMRFDELAVEEEHHEELLVSRFRERFGAEIPKVKEEDVRGIIESPDLDDPEHLIFDSLEPERVYELALAAERDAQSFYRKAAAGAEDPRLLKLYRELEEMEQGHQSWLEDRVRSQRANEGNP